MKGKSIIPAIKFVRKIVNKNEIKSLIIDASGKTPEEKALLTKERGIEVVMYLMDKIPQAEKEFFEFYASLTNKSYEEALETEAGEILNTLLGTIKDPGLQTVFQSAMK